MRWLDRFLGPPFELDEGRWLVVDVETTGLDPHHDTLLAIAGVAIDVSSDFQQTSLNVNDSFEIILRQDTPSDKDNILVHGIGIAAQRGGTEPAPALQAFDAWVGQSPLLAFHAAFDEAMIQRAFKRHLKRRLPNPWLDIEPLAKHAAPGQSARSLDDWMQHFGIRCAQRHQAIADAWSTAELLLRIWPVLRTEAKNFKTLQRIERQLRWLRRQP
jgi:DNA polymerase-3 subunit epsilon